MIHLIFLVTLWLIPLSQSQETVTSVHPTSIPEGLPTYGISIFVDGYGFSNSTDYSCIWDPYTVTIAQFISSTSLICSTPDWATDPQSGYLTISTSTNPNLITVDIEFEYGSSCLSAYPWCGVHGDPHFKPFCIGDLVPSNGFPIQPLNTQLNLVTSKDGRFKVYGLTGDYLGTNDYVTMLNTISIIGPGADGDISPNITLFAPSQAETLPNVITLDGVDISNSLPYVFNEIRIGVADNNWYYIEFPSTETVIWNGKDTVYIYLPGAKYWQNVNGLCGEIDPTYNFCQSPNGYQYSTSFDDDLLDCAYSWTVSNTSPVPIPQPTPNPSTVPMPQPVPNVPNPEVPAPPAWVVPDNFVSNVIKTICFSMFDVLEEVCPAGYTQNLPIYKTSCVYDGAALLTNRFNALQISVDTLSDPSTFFTNAEQLAKTVFDDSTYSSMVSSVHAGVHDCFFQSQNISLSAPVFNATRFYGSLPGCSSYCKFPGALCSSSGDCQLSLTLADLITLTGSSSTIYINVMFLIVCMLILSIWNSQ
jgi:hypothetical protein